MEPDQTLNTLSPLPVTIDPDILGGAPVFSGTRVPVKTLFDYIKWGYSLEEFFKLFPSVSRDAALAVFAEAERMTLEKVAGGRMRGMD